MVLSKRTSTEPMEVPGNEVHSSSKGNQEKEKQEQGTYNRRKESEGTAAAISTRLQSALPTRLCVHLEFSSIAARVRAKSSPSVSGVLRGTRQGGWRDKTELKVKPKKLITLEWHGRLVSEYD